ncbi:FGFR1 oncogene partner 2 homolog [Xenia sp. Carnegie-2017]|uniref:FGFR1 oncogene partner 2 homolog n=1 Tax=Xenia sp. Carnegie-2017 TaxID=2897299 RepID=UPI001F03A14D|nr:FGFR1 oncogene partner 2 homolog [Xenia sp. Carnegie-2017]
MMEQLLVDAKRLMLKMKEDDNAADMLVTEGTNLLNRIKAMKQYREDITKLNELAKHRPKSTLLLGSKEESTRIAELQQENIDLQTTLEDHQSALELIMSKYREHIFSLVSANRLDAEVLKTKFSNKEQSKTEQICEMASVMSKAIQIDDAAIQEEEERHAALEFENQGLRELLHISGISRSEFEEFQKERERQRGSSTPTMSD